MAHAAQPLDDAMFANDDFLAEGYRVARITILATGDDDDDDDDD